MLQENQAQNQENLTSFEILILGASSLISTNDLKPETANLLYKAFGKKLSEADPDLYAEVASLSSLYVIMDALKIKIKLGDVTPDVIQVVLKNFWPTIKHFEPALYDQLKEQETAFKEEH